jgi:hypothetical protein
MTVSQNPVNLVNPVEKRKRPRVLHNPLARRRGASFPMIGKKFSNGWKISPGFSNDWKNFSPFFQRLEKSFQWLENFSGGRSFGQDLQDGQDCRTGKKQTPIGPRAPLTNAGQCIASAYSPDTPTSHKES